MKLQIFAFILLVFVNTSGFLNADVITNQHLFKNIADWENNVENGDTQVAIAEIEVAMSANIAPWRMAVLKSKNWSYPWGFFAYKLKAQALQKTGKFVEAYRTLMDGYTYLPQKVPPKNFSEDYFKEFLL